MSSALERRIEAWLGALTLPVVLGSASVVVFLIAWNRGIALLYGMLWLLVGTLVVGFAAPRWYLRGVTARRTHPQRAYEGDQLGLTLELASTGYWPKYMLQVIDRLPFAVEEQQAAAGYVPCLRRSARIEFNVVCDLRGVHTLGPLELRSSYPLGLWTARRSVPDSSSEIIVYPQAFAIRSLPLMGQTQLPITGARAARLAGGDDEVFGVREYRHGDSPRHIHWTASARRNQWVVKEYEYINRTDVLLVLDLDERRVFGEGKHTTLEYAVKIAASLARYALEEGHGVGLFGVGQAVVEVGIGRGPAHYQALLEALARVRADGERPYAEVLHEAAARLRQGGVLVLFETPELGPEARSEQFELYQHHLKALRVSFDAESFEYPLRRPGKWGGAAGRDLVYRVRRGDDLEKVFAR